VVSLFLSEPKNSISFLDFHVLERVRIVEQEIKKRGRGYLLLFKHLIDKKKKKKKKSNLPYKVATNL
jgi:hypothetical protein